MTDWKDYFPREILIRGMQYYRKEKVKGYIESGNSCIARILGTHIYRVRIEGLQSGGLQMSCTCPQGLMGNPCKHEAAVLYEWTARRGMLEEEATLLERVIPFEKTRERSALYYDMSAITSGMKFHKDIVSKAKAMAADHTITLDRVSLYYDRMDDSGQKGMAVGKKKDGSYQGIRIMFQKDRIQQTECSECHHHYNQYYSRYAMQETELCVHETALLFLLDEYLLKYNPGDATDYMGSRFLDLFGNLQANQKVRDSDTRVKCIRLSPRITLEGAHASLGFRIGTGKLFVVKNLTELITLYKDLGSLPLGKTQRLLFAEEDFEEASLPYYHMIEKHVTDAVALNRQMQHRHRYYEEDVSLKGQMPLSGAVLDELFETAEGQAVDCQDKLYAGTTSLRIRQSKLQLALKIRPVRGASEGQSGLQITGKVPMLLEGSRYHYFISDGVLSRMTEEDYAQAAPFIQSAMYNEISMQIGRSNLAEFYYRILPVLRENDGFEIEEEDIDEIEKLLPPEVRFAFYMDLENGLISLKGECAYEEQKHPLQVLGDQDLPLAVYRDSRQESKVVEQVQEFFPQYDPEEKTFYCDQDEDAIYEILDQGVRKLSQYGEVSGTDAVRKLRIRKTPQIRIGVSVESGLFDLEILSPELSPAELLDVLESYRQKKRYHRLKSGEFVNLEEGDSLEMLFTMMKSMNMSVKDFVKGKLHLPLYRALYIDQMLEEHEEVQASRDRTFRKLIKNFKTVKESDYEIPSILMPVLRNYQKYGYKWIRTLADSGFGGILADDMGLGKTLQVISVLLAEKEEGQVGTALIVCPASLVYNWQEEILRFAPSLRTRTVTGGISERKMILKDLSEADVLVTSYDLLKRDVALYEDHIFRWQILDEAQYIKNPKAAVSKAVKIIRSEHRLALTGTPIENRLSELWSIFDFLMPGFLYGYERFRQDYETPIAKYKEEEPTERLKKMVSPFLLRRLKKDVLKDLPEKLEEVRYARFEQEQRQLYDGQIIHMKEMLSDPSLEEQGGRMKILSELTRIRQICCDPSLLVDGYAGESAKRKACMELIDSAIDGGHRMLIFSQFTSMLELLEMDLREKKIPYYKITGATPKQERLRLVHEYNKDETPVFLISLKAGGTGLNLTGADMVIHYDPWWNLAAQNQATDRAHRIGQTRTVTVYRLIVKNTIEEKILKMQEAKKDLADAILSGESESLGQMSREELLELLG